MIVDYQMGNIGSVAKKINRIGYEPVITSEPNDILKAEKIILPGVGHFAIGIMNLKEMNLFHALNVSVLNNGIPILGICLGMQLMARHSEEGDMEGFGWIDASVIKFNITDKLKYKVPHMGWNTATPVKDSRLFQNVDANAIFYFVHSYHVICNEKDNVLATTCYEHEFTSAIEKGNIMGTQFHPEKSHNWGEELLLNFSKI